MLGLTPTEGTLLTGAVGFFGGLLSSFGLFWLRQRRRRKRLRQSLLRELRVPSDAIERALDTDRGDLDGPLHAHVPTTVYESQADQIGLLTEAETDEVVGYYSVAAVVATQLERDEPPPERFFEETLPLLEGKRTAAIDTVEAAQ